MIFALKTLFPKFSHQLWFASFSVDNAMNVITENVLDICNVRSGEHIGISTLTNESA